MLLAAILFYFHQYNYKGYTPFMAAVQNSVEKKDFSFRPK
jgi:hypothetical protein